MKTVVVLLSVGFLCFGSRVHAQTTQDEEVLRELPARFSAGFNKHDAHQLAQMMADDVDFVTVGLTWLRGRSDFEKYHERLLQGRFRDIVHRVLDTHVRFIRSDLAVVRHSWSVQGDRNPDGSARPQRFGLMTMLAEKRNGGWLIIAVQNVNAPLNPPSPEAHDIRSPIVVPRAQ